MLKLPHKQIKELQFHNENNDLNYDVA